MLGTADLLGTALSTSVAPNLLLLLFSGLMLVVSTLMLRRALRSVRHPNDLLDPPNEPLLTDRPFSCATAPAWPGSWGQHPLSVY